MIARCKFRIFCGFYLLCMIVGVTVVYYFVGAKRKDQRSQGVIPLAVPNTICRYLPLLAAIWMESGHSQQQGGAIGIEISGLVAEI